MWTPRKCAKCGAEKMREVERAEVLEVDGRKFEATVKAAQCGKCREVFTPLEALERLELAVAAELARNGAMSGEAFRFMRKVLGIKAAELAELFAVSAETISRWENEAPDHGSTKRAPDRAAVALLGSLVLELLADSTATLERLRTLRNPPKPKRGPVRVELEDRPHQ